MRRNDSKEAIVELLDELEDTDESHVVLEFIGEAWVDERAQPVDNGRAEFTVPLEALRAPDGSWAIHSTATSYHVSDSLHRHENAPEWCKNGVGHSNS